MTTPYAVGELAHLTWEIHDGPTTVAPLVDAAAVELLVLAPGETMWTTYNYPPTGTIAHDGTGKYHADLLVTTSGTWKYKWQAFDGNGARIAASKDRAFVADATVFT